jgi:hypothetical protein
VLARPVDFNRIQKRPQKDPDTTLTQQHPSDSDSSSKCLMFEGHQHTYVIGSGSAKNFRMRPKHPDPPC